jgi:hypothetical protein
MPKNVGWAVPTRSQNTTNKSKTRNRITTVQTKPKKKYKKRIILFTALLAITLAIAGIFKIVSNKDTPTIAIDYAAKIDELTKPQPYDPCDNAAPLIDKAIKDYNDEFIHPSVYPNDLIRIDKILPEKIIEIQKWLASNEDSYHLIAQAVQKPYCWKESFINDGTVDENNPYQRWYDLHSLCQALVWKARFNEKDNIEQALNELMLAYRTSDYIALEVNTSVLAAYATRERISKNISDIINRTSIEQVLLQKTQQTLEKLKPDNLNLHLYIQFSKFVALDYIQHCYTDDGNGDGKFISHKFSFYTSDLFDIIDDLSQYKQYKNDVRKFAETRKITVDKLNRAHDRALQIYHLSPLSLQNKYGCLYEAEINKIIKQNQFAGSTGLIDRTFKDYHESICQHYALISILAINRYKAEKGSLPTSLQELKKEGFIKTIPIDPYTDKPLVYKVTEDNFILYSIGRNFTDDGGKYTEFESWKGTQQDGEPDR